MPFPHGNPEAYRKFLSLTLHLSRELKSSQAERTSKEGKGHYLQISAANTYSYVSQETAHLL